MSKAELLFLAIFTPFVIYFAILLYLELTSFAMLFLAVLLAWVFAAAFVLAPAEAECLKAGWPNASVDYKLNAYCIRRIDQTDEVRPLSEVRR